MKKRRLTSIFLLLSTLICLNTIDLSGQGANVYIGTSNAVNGNKSFSPEGLSQSGYLIGVDARLNADKMYFYGGLQYHVVDYQATEDFTLKSDLEKMNFFKIRVGLGYDLFYLSDLITIRGKTLGTIDLISGIPANNPILFNDGIAGVVLGLGLDVSIFTFDVELEKGLVNALNKIPDSKYDFVTFAVGVFF